MSSVWLLLEYAMDEVTVIAVFDSEAKAENAWKVAGLKANNVAVEEWTINNTDRII